VPDGFEKCGLPFGPVYDDKTPDEKDSFTKRGLAKVGTIVFMEDGENYLIGNINKMGGVCDDCMAFEKETRVLGYMILFKREEVIFKREG
jgi:hypothetical protein